jgi:O-antigen/teichoic acid export membrane protein
MVKINIAANMAGRIWTLALSLLVTPVYLRLLGIEAYGLVGFLLILQNVVGLLDLGLGATLNREVARLSAVPGSGREQRDALRTFEFIYWLSAAVIVVLFMLAAPWIANQWLNAQNLPTPQLEHAVRLMGLGVAIQFPGALYQGGLLGLQKHRLLNGIIIVTSTIRSAGAVVVLWLFAPTIQAFLEWQLFAAIVQTLAVGFFAWRALPHVGGSAKFHPAFLHRVWRYAGAVSLNAIVGIGVTQIDKVVLSKLLTLSAFGYYTLAATVAALPWAVIIPINTAIFPRFTQLVERKEHFALAKLYHEATQLLSLVLLPTTVTVCLFAQTILWVWTGDAQTAAQSGPLAALLIAGTALNGLASVPVYLQWAAGWPRYTLYYNAVSAAVLIPAILLITPRFGAMGAACIWVVLNAGYLFWNVPHLHRRLLTSEQWRWYTEDIGLPAVAAVSAGLAMRFLLPVSDNRWVALASLAFVWAVIFAACALSASRLRARLKAHFGRLATA